MYLKLNDIRKRFGTGDSHAEVLRGITCARNAGFHCRRR